MAGLRELKKRLSSIQTVGQLAGAMRTVSAAKYSRVSTVRTAFSAYAAGCEALMDRFGSELAAAIPRGNPNAPRCYVVMAGNRGLCGGYNVELSAFAIRYLHDLEGSFRVVAVGRKAESALQDGGLPPDRVFTLPDVPNFDACGELFSYLREGYMSGEFSEVHFIHQKFINTLTCQPVCAQILPMGSEASAGAPAPLFLPDRGTVLKAAALSCVDTALYSAVLSAAAAAQAATLVAMRSAYDNAQEAMGALEIQISRKRQSEVTNSVLETSSGNTN